MEFNYKMLSCGIAFNSMDSDCEVMLPSVRDGNFQENVLCRDDQTSLWMDQTKQQSHPCNKTDVNMSPENGQDVGVEDVGSDDDVKDILNTNISSINDDDDNDSGGECETLLRSYIFASSVGPLESITSYPKYSTPIQDANHDQKHHVTNSKRNHIDHVRRQGDLHNTYIVSNRSPAPVPFHHANYNYTKKLNTTYRKCVTSEMLPGARMFSSRQTMPVYRKPIKELISTHSGYEHEGDEDDTLHSPASSLGVRPPCIGEDSPDPYKASNMTYTSSNKVEQPCQKKSHKKIISKRLMYYKKHQSALITLANL